MIKQPQTGPARKVAVNDRLLGIFARDAANTVGVLNTFVSKGNDVNEEDLRQYIISVHGIKSALAYIGQADLSATALKLETAGRAEDFNIINAETIGFIASLQLLIDDILSKQEKETNSVIDEDKVFLAEQMQIIKKSAEEFSEDPISEAVSLLKGKTWSTATGKIIEEISACLLHSDFDRIVEIATSLE